MVQIILFMNFFETSRSIELNKKIVKRKVIPECKFALSFP